MFRPQRTGRDKDLAIPPARLNAAVDRHRLNIYRGARVREEDPPRCGNNHRAAAAGAGRGYATGDVHVGYRGKAGNPDRATQAEILTRRDGAYIYRAGG